jgi:undecaprenyl phosphate-alpha-L-ara4N flippase subunit ArnE
MNNRIFPHQIHFSLVLIPILLRALIPVIFKAAAVSMNTFTLRSVLTNTLYWISLAFLILQALSWQFILRDFKLSLVYPLMSLNLIILLISGHYFFDEPVMLNHLIGAAFIITGSICISFEKEKRG